MPDFTYSEHSSLHFSYFQRTTTFVTPNLPSISTIMPSATMARTKQKSKTTKAGVSTNAASKKVASKKAAATTKPSPKKTRVVPQKLVESETETEEEEKVAAPVPTNKTVKKATITKKAITGSRTKPKTTALSQPKQSKKRTRAPTEEPETQEVEKRPVKRARSVSEAPSQKSVASRVSRISAHPAPAIKYPKHVKIGSIINEAPTTRLDVFVMGSGESGELGLGPKIYNGKLKPTNVKRPRINHNLAADSVGVVNVAAGGMHSAVLTHDNRILTWGVNDQWALGRDTTWTGGLRDMDADDKSSDSGDDEDISLNPHETTPGPVDSDYFVPGTVFTQVVASDSATFALTADGRVYGWGTFRANNGILGFKNNTLVQQTPTIVQGLSKIRKLAAGDNHILALDTKGKVWAWGDGEQQQLGRRVQERTRETALIPTGVGVHNVIDIACGRNHSFAIDKKGDVWAWGSNNFGQCGVLDSAGEENAFIFKPTKLEVVPDGKKIRAIAGGNHHSVACTTDGKLLTWGRIDGSMVGHSSSKISGMDKNNLILDDRGNPRILKQAIPHDGMTSSY